MSQTYRQRRKLRLRERAMAGVAARERKRMDLVDAADIVEVGSVRFSGNVFGGDHCIRILHREDEPMRVWLDIDGQLVMPRTVRGLRAVVARRIAKAVES